MYNSYIMVSSYNHIKLTSKYNKIRHLHVTLLNITSTHKTFGVTMTNCLNDLLVYRISIEEMIRRNTELLEEKSWLYYFQTTFLVFFLHNVGKVVPNFLN